MYRRMTFISFVPLISPVSATRASFGAILAIVSMVYFREQQPFRSEEVNFIAYVAQAAILLTFYAALSIQTGVMIDFGLKDLGMGIFLAIAVSSILGMALKLGNDLLKEKRAKLAEKLRKASAMEWACEFSGNKFKTTCDSISQAAVPVSHALVFYYTSVHGARSCLRSGIPSHEAVSGVAVTFRRPHDLTDRDVQVFTDACPHPAHPNSAKTKPFEAVLALALPKRLLFPLPGHEDDPCLRWIPSYVLTALRPAVFVSVVVETPWADNFLLMPPMVIIRAYQLISDEYLASGGPDAKPKKETPPQDKDGAPPKSAIAVEEEIVSKRRESTRRRNSSFEDISGLTSTEYEYVLTSKNAGFGIKSGPTKTDLPVVSKCAKGESQPAVGDLIVAVGPDFLEGSQNTRVAFLNLLKAAPRPVTIRFVDSAKEAAEDAAAEAAEAAAGDGDGDGVRSASKPARPTAARRHHHVHHVKKGPTLYEEPTWDENIDDALGGGYPDLENLAHVSVHEGLAGVARFRSIVKRIIMTQRLANISKNMLKAKQSRPFLVRLQELFHTKETALHGVTNTLFHGNNNNGLSEPETVSEFSRRMVKIRRRVHFMGPEYVMVYHYTQPSIVPLIAKGGLRMSTRARATAASTSRPWGPSPTVSGARRTWRRGPWTATRRR